MPVIAVNANHGWPTAGRRTPDGKYQEWYLNDLTADFVQERLVQYKNVSVVRPDGDEGHIVETLQYRVKVAHQARAIFLLTIDHNAYKGTWGTHGGTGTYISLKDSPYKAESKKIARLIVDEVSKVSGLRNRNITEINWYVLREAKIPSVGIEVGFMDSRTDYPIITSKLEQKKIGYAIADQIAKHFNFELVEKLPTLTPEVNLDPDTKVMVDGVLHKTGSGQGAGSHYKGEGVIDYVRKDLSHPYHIKGLGWVLPSTVKAIEEKPKTGLKSEPLEPKIEKVEVVTYEEVKKYPVITLTKDADLWAFDAKSWSEIKSVKKFKKGDQLEVADVCTNAVGGKYYRTKYSVEKGLYNGINIVDAELGWK